MKKSHNKKLSDFEEFLNRIVSEGAETTPFSGEEVIKILNNFGPPEEVDEAEKEKLTALMKKTHERRVALERKLNNPSLIQSLGGLLKCACSFYKISVDGFARLLDLTPAEFNDCLYDRKSPQAWGEHRILIIAAFMNISINHLIEILDKTVKLMKIRGNTNLAASQARADKGLDDSTREDVIQDAMKELLLATEDLDEKDEETSAWDEFKQNLRQQAEIDESPFTGLHTSYTLQPKRARPVFRQLLQQA